MRCFLERLEMKYASCGAPATTIPNVFISREKGIVFGILEQRCGKAT